MDESVLCVVAGWRTSLAAPILDKVDYVIKVTSDALTAAHFVDQSTMKRISLHDGWTLRTDGGPVPEAIKLASVPPQVLGIVHTVLMAAGLLEGPSLGSNETDLVWMHRSAARHPAIAAIYLAESWERNIDALADAFRVLDRQGRLRIVDARLAADQFTWLTIGAPLNAQLLAPAAKQDTTPTTESAVQLFLSGYSAVRDAPSR